MDDKLSGNICISLADNKAAGNSICINAGILCRRILCRKSAYLIFHSFKCKCIGLNARSRMHSSVVKSLCRHCLQRDFLLHLPDGKEMILRSIVDADDGSCRIRIAASIFTGIPSGKVITVRCRKTSFCKSNRSVVLIALRLCSRIRSIRII